MKTYTVTVEYDGTKRWYLDGKSHREDGPAVEYADGTKYWFLDDILHRTDGPAVEYVNGNKLWYLDGKLHRTDGHAVEYADGTKEWYLNDVQYTEAEWSKRVQKKAKSSCVGKIVEIDGVKYKLVEA
tara:strand:- start:40 stop:420 length:381 start_codon:yes stop_codon:yes gene_type:complete